MKLLLVDYPHQIFPVFRGHLPSPGFLSVAAALEKAGHEIRYVDSTLLDDPWKGIENAAREFRPEAGLVTSVSTSGVNGAMNVARLLKLVDPRLPVIGGGVHMSTLPAETMAACPEIDAIVRGEGEETVCDLVAAIEGGGNGRDWAAIRGIAYRRDGDLLLTPPRPLIEDLDRLPMPAYHIIPMDRYGYPSMGMPKIGSFVLTGARGCFGVCSYCSEAAFWQNRIRAKSVPVFLDEIELLVKKYGKYCVLFGDNSFNWHRERVVEFMDEIERRGLKFNFWFQSRAEHILRDRDLLPRLKRLGLFMVSMGIETPSPTALANYRKNQSPETAAEAMRVVKQNGIVLLTNLMFGDWEDGEPELKAIFRFTKRLSDHYAMGITAPFPGTEYYLACEKAGRLEVKDWDQYDMLHPVMRTKTLTREQVGKLQQRIVARFYLRPKTLIDAIFTRNKFLRRNNLFFLKICWEFLTGTMWVQKNYETYPMFLERKRAFEKTGVIPPLKKGAVKWQ